MIETQTIHGQSDTTAVSEIERAVDEAVEASRVNQALLLRTLAAAGVVAGEHDRAVVNALARYEASLVQAVVGWIERANPAAGRGGREREALARIVERVELTGAERGDQRLVLGIVLGLAKGALGHPGRSAALDAFQAVNCWAPSGPAPRARLRLWGVSDPELHTARLIAGYAAGAKWDIVEVEQSTGIPCPIPSGDPDAVAQDKTYELAWAIHLLTTSESS